MFVAFTRRILLIRRIAIFEIIVAIPITFSLQQKPKLRYNGHTYDYCKQDKENIIHKGAFYVYIDKSVSVKSDKVAEELTEAVKVGEIENAEADNDNDFAVDMGNYEGDFLKPLRT